MTKEAQIRTFGKAEDDKLIRFMSGKARMELLAAANIRACMDYRVIAAWGALAAALIHFLGWYPVSGDYYTYVSPVAALFIAGLPAIFLMDWINRPYFEAYTQKSLAKPDIADPKTYYSRSPASGFWILEFGDSFVGLIALDASIDGPADDISFTVLPSKGTSRVAQIRHIYVVELYRPARAEIDLLEHAINHTLKANRDVQVIKHTTSDLNSYVGKALIQCGFDAVKSGSPMGVFGWKTTTYELTREIWEARTRSKS